MLVFLSVVSADRLGLAAPLESQARAPAAAALADRAASMTVTVMPRSRTGRSRDATLVYLDGRIDADAPRRLAEALERVDGRVSVWLNSPGGNLFAGMELGRILRRHGASTHIVDHRTLRPGTCYSACAMTYLGGVYRFNENGGRYGVHRASLLVGPNGERDLGEHLSAAIENYILEMGVDRRLVDLCLKAGRDEMYVLSSQEARDLGVVNNGRTPPEWSIAAFPGGTALQGRQTTIDGVGTVSFSCDGTQTVLGVIHHSGGTGEPGTAASRHLLTFGRHERIPVDPLSLSNRDGILRATFTLPPNLVRLAASARHVGYQMTPASDRPPAIDYRVDIDGRSARMVRTFLGDCLRGRAK